VSDHVVAFLRGMNTGAKNRFPMADLRAALADAGFLEPRTLLASGNVVVEAPAEAEAIERVIADAFGLRIPVITRTGAELAAVLASSPFTDVATDGAKHFVAFSAAPIDSGAVSARLEATDWGAERWAVRGRETYLWLPDGIGRSPLGAALASSSGPQVTVRNFNTVARLVTMAT